MSQVECMTALKEIGRPASLEQIHNHPAVTTSKSNITDTLRKLSIRGRVDKIDKKPTYFFPPDAKVPEQKTFSV